jgi:hypothetical protein
MTEVWQLGQARMLEVFRHARLDRLAMRSLGQKHAASELVQLAAASGTQ